MSLISSNWPLRLVCCAGLLLSMPEQSAAELGPKKASDMVSLRTINTPCLSFGGVQLDTGADGTPLALPAKKVLIVKRVVINALGTPLSRSSADVFVEDAQAATWYSETQNFTFDANGSTSREFRFDPGLRIPAGKDICIFVYPNATNTQAYGQGYLAADK